MIYTNEYVIVADEALLESGFFEEINRWKTHNQNHTISKFKSNALTDEEYERVKSCIDIMTSAEDYSEYSKAFNRFCYFCHIVSRGVVIRKYQLKKGKEKDRNSLYVEYAYNTKRMQLPEGTKLYHISKVDNIDELIPAFRGKSSKGYLYDKPRVYFTIRKNMPKFLADYGHSEKTHTYECLENVKYVYVDPLVWSNLQGAVYVESNKPIKVAKITKNSRSDDRYRNEKINESEEIDFENLFRFVTENGLIINE